MSLWIKVVKGVLINLDQVDRLWVDGEWPGQGWSINAHVPSGLYTFEHVHFFSSKELAQQGLADLTNSLTKHGFVVKFSSDGHLSYEVPTGTG